MADKTTMFVTNDHGRHTSNFSGHGDTCEGCKHVMLLVLGPDTPAGVVDTDTHQQIDIAPTIGAMLDFSTPQATGTAIASAMSGASNAAPVASSVTITGTTTVGQVLTLSYTYSDAEGDAEGVSTFRWLRNDVAVAGATSKTYTLVLADAGATIKGEVTPVAVAGTSPGTAVQSAGVGPVNVLKPVISGNTGVGSVTLSYVDTTAKTLTSNTSGAYAITVSYNWSGTVTPSLNGYTFIPPNGTYAGLVRDTANQNYSAAVAPALTNFLVEAEAGGAIPRQRPGVAFNIKITAPTAAGTRTPRSPGQ